MSSFKHTNSLIHASSPYLLQHAHNPVNWKEWSDDILVQAKSEDKLILVSIGYSSCHWCHVMEHECFEKEDTAAIMNEHFICVKIDREERPDIDQIYMNALQLLTGQGGWPLNVFTLPDGRPLHGGTYFPKAEWERVLLALSNFYADKKEEAYEFATHLSNDIKKLDQFGLTEPYSDLFPMLQNILQNWKRQFDLKWGGYNWSPKFPLPNHWELFMGIHNLTNDIIFKEASLQTLQKMHEGGIFDHLAGGFARYSTDSFWKVPHFEKMLYDNAQLMGVYAMASRYFSEPVFAEVADSIHNFICSELRSPEGGFYSALDADSEGVEGKYYVWNYEELQDLLEDNADLFCTYFSVEPNGNWAEIPHHSSAKVQEKINILYRTKDIKLISEQFQLSAAAIYKRIESCKKLLLLERSKRIPPGLDDKLICSWNALMIKGYAQAAIYMQEERYSREAVKAMDYLLSWSLDGNQIYRILKGNNKSIPGFAEDYACLIEALIQLYEAVADEKYLISAYALMQECIRKFFDTESGMFFFSSSDQSVLITRKIEVNDDVIPSSNSILAKCLYKLSFYFENNDFEDKYKNMIQVIVPKIQKYPNGYSNWMQLIAWIEKGFTQIILSGPEALDWRIKLLQSFHYNTVIIPVSAKSEIPLLKEKESTSQKTTAWICKDKTCGLPLYSIDEIISLFKN